MKLNTLNTLSAVVFSAVLFGGIAASATIAGPATSKDDDLIISTKDGFKVRTTDGDFSFGISALLTYDMYYNEGAQTRPNDSATIVSNLAAGTEFAETDSDSDGRERDVRIVFSSHTYNWQYKLGYDFADSGKFLDAYVRYTGWGNWAQLTLGNQKVPFGMDHLQHFGDILALERNILNQAFAQGRQAGFGLRGYGDMFSYHAGVYHLDDSSPLHTDDEDTLQAVRFTVKPVETRHGSFHLGWGVQTHNLRSAAARNAGTPSEAMTTAVMVGQVDDLNDATAAVTDVRERTLYLSSIGVVDTAADAYSAGTFSATVANTEAFNASAIAYPQAIVYDGIRDISFEVAGAVGPVYVQFEFMDRKFEASGSGYDDFKFNGISAQVAWAITGERRSYMADKGLYSTIGKPRRGLGAWEVYLRTSMLDLADDWESPVHYAAPTVGGMRDPVDPGGSAAVVMDDYQSMTVGVNWYINEKMRLNLSITDADIDRYACLPASRTAVAAAATALSGADDILCGQLDSDNASGQAVGVRFQYTY